MKDGGQADLSTEKSNLDHGDNMFFGACLTSTRPVSEEDQFYGPRNVLRRFPLLAAYPLLQFVFCTHFPLCSCCMATGTLDFLSHGGDILDLKNLIQRLRSAFVQRWSRIRSSTILLFLFAPITTEIFRGRRGKSTPLSSAASGMDGCDLEISWSGGFFFNEG